MTCGALAPDAGFVGGVLNFVDCQAQAIGAGGYQALATPGSTLSLVLTGLLTLFVALFGYRLLFGQTPGVRDGVLALVKIGIVLALATGWTAYRTLVYDVAFKGPAELASDIGRPAALPGAGGGLVWRLDNADRLFVGLAALGVGEAGAPAAPPPPYLTPGPATGVTVPAAQAAPGFDGLALGGARVMFLVGAAGALAALRLIAGVLLALGPFFFAFLLFDGTRGLFEGWLRVLAGTALGALGTAIALGVELALIEPRLAYLIALRRAGYAIIGAPVELFVITLVFAFALVAMLIAAARVAYGFRLPPAWRALPAFAGGAARAEGTRIAPTREPGAAPGERSRAAAVGDAVAATVRREAGPAEARLAPGASAPRPGPRPAFARDEPPPAPVPLGQSFRRTRNRASASAARRDGRR
ncbi:MAG: type secretion system protein VirB6 [Sphingomonadales bacterium]|jgi:type IV secretion system protein VirB6|nr:type secretion system protein VirB6 [Sphingomonadales bacterium]